MPQGMTGWTKQVSYSESGLTDGRASPKKLGKRKRERAGPGVRGRGPADTTEGRRSARRPNDPPSPSEAYESSQPETNPHAVPREGIAPAPRQRTRPADHRGRRAAWQAMPDIRRSLSQCPGLRIPNLPSQTGQLGLAWPVRRGPDYWSCPMRRRSSLNPARTRLSRLPSHPSGFFAGDRKQLGPCWAVGTTGSMPEAQPSRCS